MPTVTYRVTQKNAPLYQKEVGLALQIQDDISIKWSIFLGHPVYLDTQCQSSPWKVGIVKSGLSIRTVKVRML